MFCSLRNCQIFFQSSCTMLPSARQCVRHPVVLCPGWRWVLSVFCISAILVDRPVGVGPWQCLEGSRGGDRAAGMEVGPQRAQGNSYPLTDAEGRTLLTTSGRPCWWVCPSYRSALSGVEGPGVPPWDFLLACEEIEIHDFQGCPLLLTFTNTAQPDEVRGCGVQTSCWAGSPGEGALPGAWPNLHRHLWAPRMDQVFLWPNVD